MNEILQIIFWNNKLIRIDGKPVFYKTLAEKGILRIGDLISENNELITKCNLKGRYHGRYHDFWPKLTKLKLWTLC